MQDLILASASPRRRELLSLVGVDFTVKPADIDETFPSGDASVGTIARDLATQKARAIAMHSPDSLVLAADTIVAVDGDLLAKPGDADEAREMLERLRNRTHLVVTGVAIANQGRIDAFDVTTEVTMRDYTSDEVKASIARGDPFDKAGGYAIQDPLFRPVAHYQGCYTNVIGLPLGDVLRHLTAAGVLENMSAPSVKQPGCVCCPWIEGPPGVLTTNTRIRPLEADDIDAVVRLSLRAWAPVFASMEQALGTEIFNELYTDWRLDQQQAVEEVCKDEAKDIWVAEVDAGVAGFVATHLYTETHTGEIYMIAVDPDHQRAGIGANLTEFALGRFADAGMTVAMVETGGDPGHAPARRVYEQAGFTQLPIARYFKKL